MGYSVRRPGAAPVDDVVDDNGNPIVDEGADEGVVDDNGDPIISVGAVKPPADRNLLQRTAAEYPILSNYDIAFRNAPNKNDGRLLEFYPEGERNSFDPKRPAVEVYKDSVSTTDVAGDIVSHYLARGKEPKLTEFYEDFRKSISPRQEAILHRQYEEAKKNMGERRPYADWRETTGLPAYFRGYPFGQWRDKTLYTDEQKKMLDEMVRYLRSPQPRTNKATSGTFQDQLRGHARELANDPEQRFRRLAEEQKVSTPEMPQEPVWLTALSASFPAIAGWIKEEYYPHQLELGSLESLNLGAAKGAVSTATGLGKLVTGAAKGDFGTFDEPDLKEKLGADPRGFQQHTGFVAEQIAEAMAPAGSVGRGVKLTEEALANAPKAAQVGGKLATAMGLEGLANAGTAYGQTGGDEDAARMGGIIGAGARGLGTVVPAAYKAFGKTPELLELGEEFKVPLTKAQQTQGTIRGLVEALVRKTAGGFRTMAKFDVKQNEALKDAASTLVRDLDPAVMDRRQMGVFVQHQLDEAYKTAQESYGTAVEEIASEAPDARLTVDGNLSRRAAALLKQLEDPTGYVPELKSYDDYGKAIGLLKRFTKLSKTVVVEPGRPASTIVDSSGKPLIEATEDVTKEVTPTFEEARRLRSALFNLTNSEEVTVGKGAIKQLNKELDAQMKLALVNAGRGDLADSFEQASSSFRNTRRLLEEGTVKGLRDKNAPELIVDTLLSGQSETTVNNLKQLLTPEQMQRVQASVLARALERPPVTSPDDLLLGPKLKSVFDRLGNGAERELFGDNPAVLQRINRFVRLADKLHTPADAAKVAEGGRDIPLAAQLGAKAAIGALAGAGVNKVLGRDENGDWVYWGLSGAVLAITPAIMAKMLTRPAVTEDLTRALTADPLTSQGRVLASKIAAYVASEMAADQKRTGNGDGSSAELSLEMPPMPNLGGGGDDVDKALAEAEKVMKRAVAAQKAGRADEAKKLEAQYDAIMRGVPMGTKTELPEIPDDNED